MKHRLQYDQTKGFLSLSAAGATGAGGSIIATGFRTFGLQVILAGAPGTAVVKLEGSDDGGTTWFTMATWDVTAPLTSGDSVYAVDKPAAKVRANCTTLTVGAGKSVTAYITAA